MKTTLCVSLLVALAAPAVGVPGQTKEGPIEPLSQWSALVREDQLRDVVPGDNKHVAIIRDAKAWAVLWKAWRREEPVPKIDFGREIIFVITFDGPNRGGARLRLSAAGDVFGKMGSTNLGGPGFGYHILRCNRQGMKTFFGQALE
jgi:hypothetical protein